MQQNAFLLHCTILTYMYLPMQVDASVNAAKVKYSCLSCPVFFLLHLDFHSWARFIISGHLERKHTERQTATQPDSHANTNPLSELVNSSSSGISSITVISIIVVAVVVVVIVVVVIVVVVTYTLLSKAQHLNCRMHASDQTRVKCFPKNQILKTLHLLQLRCAQQ